MLETSGAPWALLMPSRSCPNQLGVQFRFSFGVTWLVNQTLNQTFPVYVQPYSASRVLLPKHPLFHRYWRAILNIPYITPSISGCLLITPTYCDYLSLSLPYKGNEYHYSDRHKRCSQAEPRIFILKSVTPFGLNRSFDLSCYLWIEGTSVIFPLFSLPVFWIMAMILLYREQFTISFRASNCKLSRCKFLCLCYWLVCYLISTCFLCVMLKVSV